MADFEGLNPEQESRAKALLIAREALKDVTLGAARLVFTVDDLVAVADYIISGEKPTSYSDVDVPVVEAEPLKLRELRVAEEAPMGDDHDK